MFAAAVLANGCYYDYDGRRGHHQGDPSLSACPVLVGPAPHLSIDTDEPFPSEPGSGVAVYIEYLSGGHWSVRTQCDTAITGEGCAFDVTAQVWSGSTSNVLGDGLESNDAAGSVCADTAFLATNTNGDNDGLFFDTTPGAPVRFTATLGNTRYPNLFYWRSEGVARVEAGGNPVDMTPTVP